MVNNLLADLGEMSLIPRSGKTPGEGNGKTSVFLLGKSYGQRSLTGYSPWNRKKVGHNLATKQQRTTHNITGNL